MTKEIKLNNGETCEYIFSNSLNEFHKFVNSDIPKCNKELSIYFNSITSKVDYDFTSLNYDDSEKCLINGDKKTLEDLMKQQKEIKKIYDKEINKTETTSDIFYYDTEGLFYDVGEYLANNPEHFLNIEMQEQKFMDIIVNIAELGHVSRQAFLNKGYYVYNVIKLLEKFNYKIRLIVCALSKDTSNKNYLLGTFITVKNYNQFAEIEKIAFSLSENFFRRLIFRAREHYKSFSYVLGSYGRSSRLNEYKELLKKVIPNFSENSIIIDNGETDFSVNRLKQLISNFANFKK